jgi:phosphatidate cytidylyltransferase
MADGKTVAKKSDLGTRTVSAVVMVALAAAALWLGGWWWNVFVLLVAGGVLFEWRGLVRAFAPSLGAAIAWNLGGIAYLGMAAALLMVMRQDFVGLSTVLAVVAMVIATDVGAYFAGRAIGGPKIAPAISPSKTWAGLFGGMVASGVAIALLMYFLRDGGTVRSLGTSAAGGIVVAVVAQAGDFFESWMKRRAGVKDSGRLIPGHGGLFDRVDGLLAVSFVLGILFLAGQVGVFG